ncbi:RanGTP-binding protein [Gaeumannomyces tritici R3-111a-1]|uniref:RanGTP-binding protein n=1 Tax=Gaeumannomyces tritici (strain R3-111a-1) TaxID=644352 RepID=J3PH86_GAET3|nr:RanGTP-binding protein [Gaeumannomyces tritici R3-111a-1]EJT69246.1 RanGTP-binding protein [Gaeumannomyces tritici R3-111a-1]
MDALLARLGAQAMNMAIRSGLALTSTYAVQQCSRLLKTVDDKSVRAELRALQQELDERIQIIAPAIDLIEFKAGRGNAFLESAVPLAKSLRRRIVALGKQLDDVAGAEEELRQSRSAASKARGSGSQSAQLRGVMEEMKRLLERIERDAHMLQFSISASGENLSTSLPPGVSPSRLMQASTFISIGDTQFANNPGRPVQIGPAFTLSLYLLFVGHSADSARLPTATGTGSDSNHSPRDASAMEPEPYGLGDGERKPIWQEVLHKARTRLCRIPYGWEFDRGCGYRPTISGSLRSPSTSEYSYHLEIIEDLDDGRVHEQEGNIIGSFDDLPLAGIRESIPVHQVSKIFYTNTGSILNIGNASGSDSNPALLLKRDPSATAPSQLVEGMLQDEGAPSPDSDDDRVASQVSQEEIDSQIRRESRGWGGSKHYPEHSPTGWSFPKHLDTEWMALEVFSDSGDDDSSSSTEDGTSEEEAKAIQINRRGKDKRLSVDSRLMAQIRDVSLGPQHEITTASSSPSRFELGEAGSSEAMIARASPFGAITSSLSLLEVLIRLTSLQEFQQASHLSIPDHILTFFLEETATTGFSGEQQLKARVEAQRKVGFDPYNDGPAR